MLGLLSHMLYYPLTMSVSEVGVGGGGGGGGGGGESLKSVNHANFWQKYKIFLLCKYLLIWDPNVPLRNPRSPYLGPRKYHMYG